MDIRGNKHYYGNMKEQPFQQAQPKLTKKQRAFVQHILENPKDSATKAALAAYGKPDKPTTYLSAGAIASENLRKPQIIMALGMANEKVESVLMNTVNDYGTSEKIQERTLAVDTAKYIHDKLHGKAKQQIDVQSTSVNISINLTSE